ncbi:phosphoribosylformylglycinamidine synthase I [bacterium]|nr:phosphoribosylformylglycinamidine synthase I [candidate division CSSED10-310 bacterium]
MRIAVLQFPGTNCEYETAAVIEAAGMTADVFRWNRRSSELAGFDGFVIPGGFSYQDRIRAGAVASKKAICAVLVEEAGKGKPILGICNGAQVLVETGLVPGNESRIDMALAHNKVIGKSGYHCDWAFIRNETQEKVGAFSRLFAPNEVIPIPVAHAEGRFVTKNANTLDTMVRNGQIGFRYCTSTGEVLEVFPVNPNGAQLNLAGAYNRAGNVLALMPHPERGAWNRQIPIDLERKGQRRLQGLEYSRMQGPGMKFFLSMRDYILEGSPVQ